MKKNYSDLRRRVVTTRILAYGISALFHPLLLPTYIFALISYFSPLAIAPLNTLDGQRFLVILVFLSTFFLPFLLLTLYIMIRSSAWSIRNFLMEDSKERVFPFMVIGVFYTVIVYFIRKTSNFNDVVLIVMTCITISILLVAVISSFWKISAHAVGISGMIGILAVINNKVPDAALFYPLVILVFLAGNLLSARLYLNAHTPAQMLGGTLLGLAVSGFSYIFI